MSKLQLNAKKLLRSFLIFSGPVPKCGLLVFLFKKMRTTIIDYFGESIRKLYGKYTISKSQSGHYPPGLPTFIQITVSITFTINTKKRPVRYYFRT